MDLDQRAKALLGMSRRTLIAAIIALRTASSEPMTRTELDQLSHEDLQALFDETKKKYGDAYDRMIAEEQKHDNEQILECRVRWAAPSIKKALADELGESYLQYKESLIQMRDSMKKTNWLVISGGVGTGKTMALTWRLEELALALAMEEDFENIDQLVVAYPAGTLFDLLHNGKPVAYFARIMGIDDYGTEYVTPFNLSQFEGLIEYRYARKLTTIITTNIPKSEFRKREGFERIESRLLKRCSWVEFEGEDRRRPAR